MALVFAVLALGVTPAAGAKPTLIQKVDIAFSAEFPCDGFNLLASLEGWITFIVFNKDGSITREIQQWHVAFTWGNSATGKSVDGIGYGPIMIDYQSETLAIVAINGLITQPEQGAIWTDVGRLVLDLNTGEVISSSGPKETPLPGTACALLA